MTTDTKPAAPAADDARLAALSAKATQGLLTIEHPLGDDVYSIVQAGKEPYEWEFFANVSPDEEGTDGPGYVSPTKAQANAAFIVALVNRYRATPPAPTFADGGWQDISTAARDVLAERRRHVEVEGWTVEHDDAHDEGEMSTAAACYAICDNEQAMERVEFFDALWPWSGNWWKPTDRRRNLVKAGALILAEIERLDHASPPRTSRPGGE